MFCDSQIIVVIERILAFSLSSPLAKFLNGLEILLSKSQVRMQLALIGYYKDLHHAFSRCDEAKLFDSIHTEK